jgi:hypothetical protein
MDFQQYLLEQGLKQSTINKHLKNIEEFGKVGQSERIMILRIEALKQTVGTRLSLAGSISKLLQFNNQPNDEIVVYIKQLNELLQEDSTKKKRNVG